MHALKGGAQKVLPCLEEWGRKKFRTSDFSVLKAPIPILNDRSLRCTIIAESIVLLITLGKGHEGVARRSCNSYGGSV